MATKTTIPSDKEIDRMIEERLATHPTPARPRTSRRLALRMGTERANEWIDNKRSEEIERCCEEG